jgi:pilus assembly protein Flp/PilA
MQALIQGIKRFVREDEGVTMVEYGLIAALIAVVCIGAVQIIGTNLNTTFGTIGTALGTANGTGGTGTGG